MATVILLFCPPKAILLHPFEGINNYLSNFFPYDVVGSVTTLKIWLYYNVTPRLQVYRQFAIQILVRVLMDIQRVHHLCNFLSSS